ncbi:TetR family transcriptional regulator [Glutamicibacter sp. MNS18]|uniref:TetR/AcrR family transcriptional regulator n=1 Tax=Glutamicibacter sp. MNS18 TaxID=2989817 RepID=UPI002235F81D|nr:TetR family transcriptional regulator [Glutamicibacter sp. MNS18]MCW4466356.1 TetR family transcriptional regulator [Glutamicibacter sp. MNS18]
MANIVRDRVREKIKIELAEQVYPLFVREGLRNVTSERAARAAGVSKATFFRYFASKEDAVLTALRSQGSRLTEVFSGLESLPGESLLELLRRSFEFPLSAAEHDPEAALRGIRLVWDSPSLRAGWAELRRQQQDELVRALLPFCANVRLAQTAVVIALTLLDHALERWAEYPDESLRAILDEAFDYASAIDNSWPLGSSSGDRIKIPQEAGAA